MARGNYSLGKRQREAERARKKRDKAQKRQYRREVGPGEVQVAEAEVEASPSIEDVMRTLQSPANRNKGSSAPPCRLFVGGLSWDTTEETLRGAFTAFGKVLDAAVVKDRGTGESRGFGFITMESAKVANKAIDELNDTELDGRSILVKIATERKR